MRSRSLCPFLKPVPQLFHLRSHATLGCASRGAVLLHAAPVVPHRGDVASKQRAEMKKEREGANLDFTHPFLLNNGSLFPGFVCVWEWERGESPNSTQVFHSELIEGDIFGFSCKHSFTGDAVCLSERHLQQSVTQMHLKSRSNTVCIVLIAAISCEKHFSCICSLWFSLNVTIKCAGEMFAWRCDECNN